MTEAEKLTMLQTICGDSEATSAMLSIYLDLAADIVVHKAFPFLTNYVLAEVPDQYSTLQVQIANELYLHRGAEGEKDHTENGVKRTYETGSVSESLLKKIVPFTRVIGTKIPNETIVKVSQSSVSLTVSQTASVTAFTEVYFPDAEMINVDEGYYFESSNTTVATVIDGVITAKATGDATITVTGKKSGGQATITVSVT